MTRLFNNPADFREELIEGFTAAYGRLVRRVPGASGVMSVQPPGPDRVALVVGGGSGHYPAFCGYVGPGLADAAVMGNVFAAPSAEQVYRVAKAVAGPRGVLFCYGNYSGDVLNFDLAQERLAAEGIDARTVRVNDDVASAPPAQAEDRRGIAGDFFVFKAAGASAARGDSLDEVERLAAAANAATRSFGVAFGGCTLPGQAAPLFTVAPGQMELGLGVHGEPGIRSSHMRPAAEVAGLLLETLLAERPAAGGPGAEGPGAGGRQVAVLLNGLGSTQYEELFVLYKDIARGLAAAGLTPYNPIVAEAVTSLDMAGCSLSLLWLDAELAALLDAPCRSAAYTHTGPLGS